MSRNHRVALEIIYSRFTKLQAGDSSAQLHAETSMAVEMAYALGAIGIDEHRHYVAHQNRIIERQHHELMQKLESYRQ